MKLTLHDFLRVKDPIISTYVNITDFKRVLALEDANVVTSIEKVIKSHDKAVEGLRDRAKKGEDEAKLTEEYAKILNEVIEIDLPKIKKSDLENVKINIYQYQIIKQLID